ncbi:MAG: TetR/AcrR family transcriptional regulator [Polaribacter sp.]
MLNSKSISGSVRKKNEQLILDAAKKEFVVNGFQGASIKSIAARAGIPRANIHYYFEGKADIYRQLLDGILDTWNSGYDTLLADSTPKEALTAYIRSKIMYSKLDPDASRIFASEIIHGAPVLSDYLSGEFKHWIQSKVKVIESWIEKGQMDKVNPYHLIFLIWSSTQHYADFSVQVLAGLDKEKMADVDFEEVVESLTNIILKGCGVSS